MSQETFIIGVSGKKQSGKDTLCSSLKQMIQVKYGDSCKIYSFADALKEKVCMEVMGLTREQCYGTDEQKNTSTIYKWESLPLEVRLNNRLGDQQIDITTISPVLHEGFMTAREIMQIVGTDIFRKYFDDSIWVNATFRSIKKDGCTFALISDVRFPSEVNGIVKENGTVFRLLRDVCKADNHASETSLDDYDWKAIEEYACIIDNREMSIEEQNREVFKIMNNIFCEEETTSLFEDMKDKRQ
jgi:hypothetical protein